MITSRLRGLLVIGCLLVASPLRAADDAKTEAKEESSDKVHKVEPQPLAVRVKLDGVIESTSTAPVALAPEVWTDLRVLKAVEAGTRVTKGQPLVWLDTRALDEEIAELEFARGQSEVALRQAAIDL